MPNRTSSSGSSLLIAGLDKLQEVARARITEIETAEGVDATRGDIVTKGAATASADLDRWDLFLVHAQQLREMLAREPKLVPVVDDFISQHYRRLERRQWGTNALFMVGGALAGWLFSSAGSPLTVLHLLVH